MSKPVKAMITAELKERFAGMHGACVVDVTGMNVPEQESLRRRLREKAARLEVVKNSLARRAFQDGPLSPLGEVLQGPCALVTSSDSLIDAAKVLVEAAKDFATLDLKQALVEGESDVITVADVAKMKSRIELLGDLAGLIGAPGRAIAGCLQAPASEIAGCLQAMIDKAA